jgi:phosphoglycolate phosphatase
MGTYKYILFDLDGTLTDPKVGITKSIQYALSKYDIKVDNLEELEMFIGPPLKETFKEYYSFNDDKVVQAIEYYREYFSQRGIFENEVYPGIRELLDELKNKGKVLVVATSKTTFFAEKILEHFKLEEYFDFVVGSNFDGTRTDKAEIIQHIFSKLKIQNVDEVIMIGDRKHDVIGGKKSGIDTIAVTYGYGSYQELKEVKPTWFVDNLKDLLPIIA